MGTIVIFIVKLQNNFKETHSQNEPSEFSRFFFFFFTLIDMYIYFSFLLYFKCFILKKQILIVQAMTVL